MFDIRDYYKDHRQGRGEGDGMYPLGDIETDISLDLDNLLANRFDSPYKRDRFKHRGHSIEIIYPRLSYSGNRSLLKGPDTIRNLLSLYPIKSDIENIHKIVLRPRYIEIGSIEFMALYLRRQRILVMYLHHPHHYTLNNAKFAAYAEFFAEDLARHLGHRGKAVSAGNPEAEIPVPPLWYILSVINTGDDDTIDKFFVRMNKQNHRETAALLYEISFFYSRHGY